MVVTIAGINHNSSFYIAFLLPNISVHTTGPSFARVTNGELVIEPITDDNPPRTQKELLWRLFVVKSVIPKSELINIKNNM